ncbi:hypothetical protein Cs7R123_78200 [Catellatospora sp. TT07R-123]|uniref:hypothetical protein n=1 Tax=Catellatospora sp. TT07R-123 TaxID=2733863 RepID=UPI001B03C5AE|nr:hypothetical protein [Catellatospora sp. TT07R-123]GHJ50478.1 hypothetical protein Cs7R123_78200 [Catellatospora sp. TT07R-123]
MTTEQDAVRDEVEPPPPDRAVSHRAVLAVGGVSAVLVAWFFWAWLGLRRNIVDAAGESIGSAIALLLVVSIAGATWRARR